MTFGSYEREEAVKKALIDGKRLTEAEKQGLWGAANQAGHWGQKAREALEADKNR